MKRLLIVLILALPLVANAQLSPRLDSMRGYVTFLADMPLTGTDAIDTTGISRAINMAVQATCMDFFGAIQKFDTVLVDSASEGGALNSDFLAIKDVFFSLGDTLRIPLSPLNGDSLFKLRPTLLGNLMELANFLSVRSYHVQNNRLIVHPKWFRGDTAKYFVEYFAVDTLLQASASQMQIRPEFRRKVIYHAVATLWAKKKDYMASAYWMSLYSKGL